VSASCFSRAKYLATTRMSTPQFYSQGHLEPVGILKELLGLIKGLGVVDIAGLDSLLKSCAISTAPVRMVLVES